MRQFSEAFLVGLAVLGLALTASPAGATTLVNGAGASFPYPLYAKWFSEFHKSHPDVEINYQSIGSGGGIRQFLDRTIDFGASDAPMTDEQLSKASAPLLHIPTVLGAVVMTYNVPGVSTPLHLSPDVLADIFLGKITTWNEPRLRKLNPGVKLPDTAILVAHRSDGSGTTNIFTDYLSKVSSEWKTKVGASTAVKWPVGLGGKGNEGVSGIVKQTPGSVGYVELVYAANNQLPYAWLSNSAGHFVEPSLKSVTAAAAGALNRMPADFRVSITNADGKDAYPISGFTYLLVWKKMPEATKGQKIVEFLHWALTEGQKEAAGLQYAPLPSSVVQRVEAKVREIQIEKRPAAR